MLFIYLISVVCFPLIHNIDNNFLLFQDVRGPRFKEKLRELFTLFTETHDQVSVIFSTILVCLFNSSFYRTINFFSKYWISFVLELFEILLSIYLLIIDLHVVFECTRCLITVNDWFLLLFATVCQAVIPSRSCGNQGFHQSPWGVVYQQMASRLQQLQATHPSYF